MLKKFLILIILGFSTTSGAKSIFDQVKDDGLKVAIDYSAIINKQLITENICHTKYSPTKFNTSGVPVKMLGYASVYMGAGPGVSKFGHLGERFVYCIGNDLKDIYYDGIKLTKEAIPQFERDYPEASEEYINSKKVMNAIYYRKIPNPTEINVYGSDTVLTNRNIYEQWLDISEKEMYELLIRNINRVHNQSLKVSKMAPLPAFRGLLNNCTYEVTDDLRSIPKLKSIQLETVGTTTNYIDNSETPNTVTLSDYVNSVVPKSVFRALGEGHITRLLIIYPSQENMRKIFFENASMAKSIKMLEVPLINFNPKYAKDWSEEEMNQLKTSLIDYKSPLALFFMERVQN